MELFYDFGANFRIAANGSPVAYPQRSPTRLHRFLNEAEFEWIRHQWQSMSPADRRLVGPAPRTIPPVNGGERGLPEFVNASADRAHALRVWERLVDPVEVLGLLRSAPLFSPHTTANTMPVLRLTYDLSEYDLAPGTPFRTGSHDVHTIDHAVNDVVTYRTITPEILSQLRAFAIAERRRRTYSSNVVEDHLDSSLGSIADFYEGTLQLIPRLWPTTVQIRSVPRDGSARAGTTQGAWFPFFLTLFDKCPVLRLFLARELGVFTSEEHYRSFMQTTNANATPFSLGCFFYAFTRQAASLCTTFERQAFERVILNNTHTPVGTVHAENPQLPVVTLRCARQLFAKAVALTATLERESGALPPSIVESVTQGPLYGECTYQYHAVNTAHGRQNKREYVYWNPANPKSTSSRKPVMPANARILRFGCLWGHYFALRSTAFPEDHIDLADLCEGIRKGGLRKILEMTSLTELHALNEFSMLIQLATDGHTIRRSIAPIDTFTFLRMIIVEGTEGVHYERIRFGALVPAEETTSYPASSSSVTELRNVAESPLRFACYGGPDEVRSDMTKPVIPHERPADNPSVTHQTWDPPSRTFTYVADTEDTSERHECYMIAAARVQSPAFPSWSEYFAPGEHLVTDRFFTHLVADVISALPFGTFQSLPFTSVSRELAYCLQWWDVQTNKRKKLPCAFDFFNRCRLADGWTIGQIAKFQEIEAKLHEWDVWTSRAVKSFGEAANHPEIGSVLRKYEISFLQTAHPRPLTVNIWCHNLAYDFPHLFHQARLFGMILDESAFLPKDGKVITTRIYFPRYHLVIVFRDSWRLFGPTMSVAKMPKAFGFADDGKLHKELFLHDWLADGKLWKTHGLGGINTTVPIDVLRGIALMSAQSPWSLRPFDFDGFLVSATKANLIQESSQEVFLWKYCAFYCELDCYITARALSAFQAQTAKLTEHLPASRQVNALECLSASSLSHRVMRACGVYENCCALDGMLSCFFSNFVVGGRCTVAYNLKCIRTIPGQPIEDIDARSLYPSAFQRLSSEFGGILQGSPIRIVTQKYRTAADLLCDPEVSGFFVRFQCLPSIAPPPINYPLGLYARKPQRDGSLAGFSADSLAWVNDLRDTECFPNGLFFDRVSMQDYLDHQPMYSSRDFIVIDGYVFKEGRNPNVRQVVEKLYAQRAVSTNDAERELLKLILNGAYGKTLEKPVPFRSVVVSSESAMLVKVDQNYSFVRSVTPFMKEGDEFLIEIARPLSTSYNLCHVGAEVLSMARRIMNGITCRLVPTEEEAEQLRSTRIVPLGCPMYTDTDSFHLYRCDWERISANANLMGNELGQFHSDFRPVPGASTVESREAIYVDKKTYCHRLACLKLDGVTWFQSAQYSMKGITVDAMKHFLRADHITNAHDPSIESDDCERCSFFEAIYEPLFDGKQLTFDLDATSSGGAKRPLFRIDRRASGFVIRTARPGFHRTVGVRQVSAKEKQAKRRCLEPPPVIDLTRSSSVERSSSGAAAAAAAAAGSGSSQRSSEVVEVLDSEDDGSTDANSSDTELVL